MRRIVTGWDNTIAEAGGLDAMGRSELQPTNARVAAPTSQIRA